MGRRSRLLAVLILAGFGLLSQGCATQPERPTGPTFQTTEQVLAQAKTAYLNEDYQRALMLLRPLANANVATAQYALGYMYYYGHGVPQDPKVGQQWIRRAAEQGDAKAKAALELLQRQQEQGRPAESGPQSETGIPEGQLAPPPPATQPMAPGTNRPEAAPYNAPPGAATQ